MNFDLNINNYTRDELIEMFELPNHFDRNIVEIKETQLRDSILNNTEINKKTKEETLNFIVNAKNIILNNNQQKNTKTHLQEKIEDFYNSSYELKSTKIEDQQEHMVQVRSQKPYLSSSPSEFFEGVINPIKKRTIRKNINIDSKFRENYYTTSSSNFNINLTMTLYNILQMQLAAIELPTTYYVISKQYGNNFFSINVNELGNKVITIPDGNYDQNTIMDAINNQILLLPAPYNQLSFEINLTNGITGSAETMVGFTSLTGITSLTLDFQADKYGISDTGTPLPLKFGWILGFRNGVYVNNLNYVSEGVVDITGPKYLFLVVDDYKNNVNNSFYSAFNSSILNKNILARISLQAKTFDVLEQNNLNVITTPREYFGPVNLNALTIQLLDEYGRIVDLNNMDFSFCLTLVTRYDL
jgi:hypothetical protein